MKKVLFLIIFVLCVSSIGCGRLFAPSYPKAELPKIIQNLCKEEYGITDKIDIKIAGKTLGVRITLDELLDINLKLQEKPLEKLQDLLKVIRRICLSTDADLSFFVLIGYEKKLGIEVIFYSYIDDLKRVIAGWMSTDDYFQRLIKNMQVNTLRWGNNRVEKFIKDIEACNIIKIVVNNFSTGLKLSELNPDFLKMLADLGKKSYVKWSIIKCNSMPVANQERLYYIEAKEYYTPKPEVIEAFQYPSGTVHKLYILIKIDDLNAVITNVFTPASLPEKYVKLGAPSTWNAEDFFVEDFTFQDFLSTQIVQRIQSELGGNIKENRENEQTKDAKETSYSLKGDFVVRDTLDTQIKLTDPSKNIFKITINSKKSTTVDLPQKTIDLILKTTREVCDKYKFYDLGEIRLEDSRGNSLFTIDKSTLFKKNW